MNKSALNKNSGVLSGEWISTVQKHAIRLLSDVRPFLSPCTPQLVSLANGIDGRL